MLSRHTCCVLSRLLCNGHSLLLSSCLSRIGRIENPSCSACCHLSQDTSHLIQHCPATDTLRCLPFRDSVSLYNLWYRPHKIARLLRLHDVPPWLHPSEGVGQQLQQHIQQCLAFQKISLGLKYIHDKRAVLGELIQPFATRDHHMTIFSKVARFLHKHFR